MAKRWAWAAVEGRRVHACRVWRSGAGSTCRSGTGRAAFLVVHGLHWLGEGTVGGGEVLATSQTRWARLVLPLACCPPWGGMVRLGLLTIDGKASLQWC